MVSHFRCRPFRSVCRKPAHSFENTSKPLRPDARSLYRSTAGKSESISASKRPSERQRPLLHMTQYSVRHPPSFYFSRRSMRVGHLRQSNLQEARTLSAVRCKQRCVCRVTWRLANCKSSLHLPLQSTSHDWANSFWQGASLALLQEPPSCPQALMSDYQVFWHPALFGHVKPRSQAQVTVASELLTLSSVAYEEDTQPLNDWLHL